MRGLKIIAIAVMIFALVISAANALNREVNRDKMEELEKEAARLPIHFSLPEISENDLKVHFVIEKGEVTYEPGAMEKNLKGNLDVIGREYDKQGGSKLYVRHETVDQLPCEKDIMLLKPSSNSPKVMAIIAVKGYLEQWVEIDIAKAYSDGVLIKLVN